MLVGNEGGGAWPPSTPDLARRSGRFPALPYPPAGHSIVRLSGGLDPLWPGSDKSQGVGGRRPPWGHAKEFGELPGLRLINATLAVQEFRYTAIGPHGPEVARFPVFLSEEICQHLVRFGLGKRVRPVLVFIDQDAKQFQKPALLLGHLIF